MRSQLQTEVLIPTNLADAYEFVIATPGVALLAVGLEGCDSCTILCADLKCLLGADTTITVRYAKVDPDLTADIQAALKLRLQEYPTLFALIAGNVIGGWTGYDYKVAKSQRLAALDELVSDLDRQSSRASENQ